MLKHQKCMHQRADRTCRGEPEVMRVGTGGGIPITFDPYEDSILYTQNYSNSSIEDRQLAESPQYSQ